MSATAARAAHAHVVYACVCLCVCITNSSACKVNNSNAVNQLCNGNKPKKARSKSAFSEL